jgi:hypothetical protein
MANMDIVPSISAVEAPIDNEKKEKRDQKRLEYQKIAKIVAITRKHIPPFDKSKIELNAKYSNLFVRNVNINKTDDSKEEKYYGDYFQVPLSVFAFSMLKDCLPSEEDADSVQLAADGIESVKLDITNARFTMNQNMFDFFAMCIIDIDQFIKTFTVKINDQVHTKFPELAGDELADKVIVVIIEQFIKTYDHPYIKNLIETHNVNELLEAVKLANYLGESFAFIHHILLRKMAQTSITVFDVSNSAEKITKLKGKLQNEKEEEKIEKTNKKIVDLLSKMDKAQNELEIPLLNGSEFTDIVNFNDPMVLLMGILNGLGGENTEGVEMTEEQENEIIERFPFLKGGDDENDDDDDDDDEEDYEECDDDYNFNDESKDQSCCSISAAPMDTQESDENQSCASISAAPTDNDEMDEVD